MKLYLKVNDAHNDFNSWFFKKYNIPKEYSFKSFKLMHILKMYYDKAFQTNEMITKNYIPNAPTINI